MADRFVVPLALLPLSDPLRLGIWFVCLVIFGFAYYTNPTEKSFKRFLDQLPIAASQKPLQRRDHLNNPASSLKTKNKAQQNSPKQGAAHQNSKNPSRTSSASPKLSFSLCTSHYNRHNLLICTLISIDHSHHSVYNVSSNLAAEDGYPQLEWFLGCFDTWISLRRQISPALQSLSIASSLDHLKLLWNKWALHIPGAFLLSVPLTDELLESLQNPSPLSKGRRKKSHKSQKLASVRCQTTLHSNHITGCSPLEECFNSACPESEHNCYVTQVLSHYRLISIVLVTQPYCAWPSSLPPPASTPSSPSASSHQPVNTGASVTASPGNVEIKARSTGHLTPRSRRLVPLKLDTPPLPEPAGPTNSTTCDSLLTSSDSSSSISTQCHDNTSPTPSSGGCSKEDLAQGSTRESCKPSSECCQPHAKQHLELVSQDLENQLKELDYRRNQEDLNKKHYQSSLKHLNEIKDLKEFKQRNLDEKLSQSKSAYAKLSKQSAKFQEDLLAIQSKCAAIQSRFSQDTQQIKKEGARTTTAIKHSKAELEQLSRASEAKTAKKKELKEKLATRQAKLSDKMELNQCSKPDSKPPTKKNSEAQKPIPAPRNCTTSSQIPLEETENLMAELPQGCATTAHSSSTWPHFRDSFVPLPAENSATPTSFHNLPQEGYPVDEGWTPDPWSETIQQNKIRETFISLPNLERSALKDHYPLLRTLNTFNAHPPFPTSPLRDEFFTYRHEVNHLPCGAGLTSYLASPVGSQPSSPLGAIGQQGSPTRGPAQSSSVGFNPSPFRLPDSSVLIPSSNCGGLLVGPGYKRQENFSRNSSSSSLSQIPGFCSIRSSPVSQYAPIGTPARSNHQRLNELQESSGKSNHDCTFGRLNQDSKAVEADYAHNSGALGINASSRLIKSSIVGLSGRETSGGLFPTGTIVEETSPGVKKQHSTQSLDGIHPPPPESRGLNSIFDIAPETEWPSTTHAQKRPLAASPRLNPSAKAFTFSPSKLSPVTRACPTSSIGQQRVRGYSQSTIPSAVASATRLLGQDTTPDFPSESAEAAKLRKSLHRSSWSMVVGLKSTMGGASADNTGEISGARLQPKVEKTCVPLESMMMSKPTDEWKLKVPSPELASVLSPGHALPAEFTKAACAGLFGPIGDCKSRKSDTLS
ncbi:hypothetical protein VP01_1885g1 [Puccinia sorghi]|uniref:Uncharacterized protein n=1 Tax=Puccinia sorghi TaxID=27349 RepID=A0A0L6VEX2_9BASI|nr:hypothetical protein VP01_1885g1 [Puccinia sorghi]